LKAVSEEELKAISLKLPYMMIKIEMVLENRLHREVKVNIFE
jgi:hypothetical protein